jgi:murein DD-endopeptidase MepM/ murein hydrolase activator NlpD
VRTRVVVSDGGGVLAPVEWDGMGEQGDRAFLWPFVRRVDVPESFRSGTVHVEATALLGTQPASFEGDWKVRSATPVELKGPVLGAWQLTNGPGQRNLHAHYRSPEQRWSYDFVVVEQGATFRGEPHKNSSYFAWGRTVRAAADGLVVDACDREPDNPALGASGSVVRAASPCHVNRVVLRHDDGTFTVYFHLRQRSVAAGVLPGQRVRAGQVIAQVGNSGSSEPHLHFLAYRIDGTGRPVAVPVSFTNAFEDSAATRRVVGVPLGGTAAHFVGPE